MSKEFGNDFITIVDDDGAEFELELLDTMDYNGGSFAAFLPTFRRTIPNTASSFCASFPMRTGWTFSSPSTTMTNFRMFMSIFPFCSLMTTKTRNKFRHSA